LLVIGGGVAVLMSGCCCTALLHRAFCRRSRQPMSGAAVEHHPDPARSAPGVDPDGISVKVDADPVLALAASPEDQLRTNAQPAAGTDAALGSAFATRGRPSGEAGVARWRIDVVPPGSFVWNTLCSLLAVEEPRHLGFGRDVKEPGRYSKLTPIHAWQIDAPSRQSKYMLERQDIQQNLTMISGADGMGVPTLNTKLDSPASQLGVDSSVNEKFLLHGTQPERVMAILNNGMNERFSGGHFGKGIYLAEDAAKMDQYGTSDTRESEGPPGLHQCLYASHGIEHPGRVYYAFICRTTLGFPVCTKDGQVDIRNPEQAVFAGSDQRELAAIPKVDPPIPYNAMIVETGPAAEGYALVRHREFVVFHAIQILPEFLIAYKRE